MRKITNEVNLDSSLDDSAIFEILFALSRLRGWKNSPMGVLYVYDKIPGSRSSNFAKKF